MQPDQTQTAELVEELRLYAEAESRSYSNSTQKAFAAKLNASADRLEALRLRAELADELAPRLQDAQAERDALSSERERLREALEDVQGDVYLWRIEERGAWADEDALLDHLSDSARTALHTEEGESSG